MTTDRDNLAAILLAYIEDKAQYQNADGDWIKPDQYWRPKDIRDNIDRFRIKPEVADVALECESIASFLCTTVWSGDNGRVIKDAYTRLTALAESIRGMQG